MTTQTPGPDDQTEDFSSAPWVAASLAPSDPSAPAKTTQDDLSKADWKKHRSNLEIAVLSDGMVAMRHAKRPGVVLLFTPPEWRAHVEGVKGDEFEYEDLPRVRQQP